MGGKVKKRKKNKTHQQRKYSYLVYFTVSRIPPTVKHMQASVSHDSEVLRRGHRNTLPVKRAEFHLRVRRTYHSKRTTEQGKMEQSARKQLR